MDASAYRVERPSSTLRGTPQLSGAAEAAGERVYRQLTPAEQQQLRTSFESEAGAEAFRAQLDGLVGACIQRRLAAGLPCDTFAVVDEVMPEALASVPESARAALMRNVHRLLDLPMAGDGHSLSRVDGSVP